MKTDQQLVQSVMEGNQIVAKDRQQFEDLVELSARLHYHTTDSTRCINCDHNITGHCDVFKTDIPEGHLYATNDCTEWEKNLPF